MKRWLLVGVVLFSPLLGMAADEEGHEGLSVEVVLQEIMASQGVERIQDVDPDRVASELLEELGDAVMEEAHPGEAHEIMDAMMGGRFGEPRRHAQGHGLPLPGGAGEWQGGPLGWG